MKKILLQEQLQGKQDVKSRGRITTPPYPTSYKLASESGENRCEWLFSGQCQHLQGEKGAKSKRGESRPVGCAHGK